MSDGDDEIDAEHTRAERADEISDNRLLEFYNDAVDVWQEMGQLGDGDSGAETLIVPGTDVTGTRAWYHYDQQKTHIELPDGYDVDANDRLSAARAWSPRADADEVPNEILTWDHRLPHLTINYQQRSMDDWATRVTDTETDEQTWLPEKPLPDYPDIQALSLFADVDFSADAKTRPVDSDTRQRIENILEQWIDGYAAAVGGDTGAVGVLDSVGGTYVMLRPAVTAPICDYAHDELDADARGALINEIGTRWREHTKEIDSTVNDGANGDWDAFGLDGKTHKNRLHKAPLALHKSLPGIVTPIQTDDVTFEMTHFDDIDSDVFNRAQQWAATFTSRADTETEEQWAGELLNTLFEDVAADTWREDVAEWAEKRDETDEKAAEGALQNTGSSGLTGSNDIVDPKELAAGETFVTDKTSLWDAIDSCNCRRVASELNIIASGENQKNDDVTRIDVVWRGSGSGDSAMVNEDVFTDMDGMEPKGGPASLVAYTLIGSDNTEPEGWRDVGDHVETVLTWFYQSTLDIPIYIPERGENYNTTPDWALRRVAELLDIAPPAAFDAETDVCIIPSLHNRILAVLDAVGIDHARERKTVQQAADGSDIAVAEHDVDIDTNTPSSDAVAELLDEPQPTSETPDDTADESDTEAARYDIGARASVDDDLSVEVPGVDLRWLELNDGRCGWGWKRQEKVPKSDSPGYEMVIHYDIVINADLELCSRLEFPNDDDRHTEWELKVNPTHDGAPSRIVDITPAAFNNSQKFREDVIGGTESVVFNSHGKGASATNELKQLVNAQDAPRKNAHSKIEVVHDADTDTDAAQLVTPNGTITPDGWADDPDHVFHGAVSGVKASWQPDPNAIGSADDELVQNVCEMLPRIRDTDQEQWLAWMGYAFASTYRSTLFNQPSSNIDSWNILHVSGKTGAGKSALAKVLNGALGMDMKSTTSAEKTPHAQLEMFCATDGAPIMMDEYNPTNWRQYVTDAFHEHLKKSTDSQTVEKGNADKSLTQYKLESSPVVIGEQQLPEDMAALPRRAVEISLSTQGVKAGSQTAALFQELRALRDENFQSGVYHHALQWWQHVVDDVGDPNAMVTEWHETMEWIRDELQTRGIELNSALEREMHQQGLQTVVFGLQHWRSFAIEQGADDAALFDNADILDVCQYLIERKTGGSAHSLNNEDALIELFADAASVIDGSTGEFSSPSQKYVEYGTHYTITNQNRSEPSELRIHLKSALPELSRYVRDYGIDHNLYQRSDYFRWFKTSAGDPDSKVVDESIRSRLEDTQRRCVAIDVEQLTDDLAVHRTDILPPWERIPSKATTSDDDSDDSDDDRGEDDSQTHPKISALSDITASQPVASTTATIEFGEYDHTAAGASDDGPAIKATLTDGDTEAKLIAWDADDITLPVDEYGAVNCDEVTVRSVTPDDYQGTLQLKANEQTVVHEGVPDGQESVTSVGEHTTTTTGDSDSTTETGTNTSDAAGDQSSTATTDGGHVGSDTDNTDQANTPGTPGTDETNKTGQSTERTGAPKSKAQRNGKVRGQIQACNQNGVDATVDLLAERLDWTVETTDEVIQELLDAGRLMGTAESGYRVIDD
jgi:energy-coupling factor transporter ATP-binding protein EcfA2